MDKLVYSITEAAEALGISRSYAYQMVKEKKLPVLELGRRKVVTRAALERMLQNVDYEESR